MTVTLDQVKEYYQKHQCLIVATQKLQTVGQQMDFGRGAVRLDYEVANSAKWLVVSEASLRDWERQAQRMGYPPPYYTSKPYLYRIEAMD